MRVPEPTTDEPTTETIARWIDERRARATDGCWIPSNLPACSHGRPNWLVVLGVESDATGE
jgi:hypothetical protein